MRNFIRLLLLPLLVLTFVSTGWDHAQAGIGLADAIPASEYQALQLFYQQTGSAGWTFSDGWNDPTSFYWRGVTLTGVVYNQEGNDIVQRGNVSATDLENNNLQGGLDALAGLPDLTIVELTYGHLTGTLAPWPVFRC